MYCQAYFEYDTKKSFGITKSHLRFGKKPISSTYYVSHADFIACHNQTYLTKYDIISELKPHGSFLLNCEWSEDELEQQMPGDILKYIAENDIKFYIIDANKECPVSGPGQPLQHGTAGCLLQAGQRYPRGGRRGAYEGCRKKTYGLKGEKIVNMNIAAVDAGINALVQVNVKPEWKNLTSGAAIQPAPPMCPPLSRTFWCPLTPRRAICCPFPPLRAWRTVPCRWALPSMKSAASPHICLCGTSRVPAVQHVLVRVPPRRNPGLSWWTRRRPKNAPAGYGSGGRQGPCCRA